jgi:DNA-binding transcriptional LysR family regulator
MESTLDPDWFARHRLKLRHLGVLLAVERTRNIGRAARELHISQPAISKTLQELERATGMPLFERRANGSFPTLAGEALVRYAKEVFGALDRAGRELQTISGGLAGTLAIGCSQSCSAHVLPKALSALKRASPMLSIKVSYESLEVLLRELRARNLDVVVARNPHGRDPGDLKEHARFELPMAVICATTHPLAKAKRVSWKALAASPWILPPQGTALRDDTEELFKLQGIKPLEAGIESASLFANSVLLSELGALSIAPLELARRLQGEGMFSILPVKVPPVFGPNCVVTLRDREVNPAMESFLAALAAAV